MSRLCQDDCKGSGAVSKEGSASWPLAKEHFVFIKSKLQEWGINMLYMIGGEGGNRGGGTAGGVVQVRVGGQRARCFHCVRVMHGCRGSAKKRPAKQDACQGGFPISKIRRKRV